MSAGVSKFLSKGPSDHVTPAETSLQHLDINVPLCLHRSVWSGMQARVPFTGCPEEEEEEGGGVEDFVPAAVLEAAQRLEVCGLSPPGVFTHAVCVFPMQPLA